MSETPISLTRSRRFERRAERPVNKDSFVQEAADLGLVVMNSPHDPKPSIRIARGKIVEIDGRSEDQFDLIDKYIARYAIDARDRRGRDGDWIRSHWRACWSTSTCRATGLSRSLCGCTPAKLCEVVGHLNVVEMMMALQKMRARRRPGNQAHVTNWRENPALMAADAAEAALRGFDELETTCRVARMAPFNALAILVGSQTPRGGVLTQCAVEEGLNLRLGLKGLTSYAETLSVYGTDEALRDGDDTPWSKGFLASAYASRGIKIRFTSGTGSETLMGYEAGQSMLYLEARCLLLVKGTGAQGRAERIDQLHRASLPPYPAACAPSSPRISSLPHSGLRSRPAMTRCRRIPICARRQSSCCSSCRGAISSHLATVPCRARTICSAAVISMPMTWMTGW